MTSRWIVYYDDAKSITLIGGYIGDNPGSKSITLIGGYIGDKAQEANVSIWGKCSNTGGKFILPLFNISRGLCQGSNESSVSSATAVDHQPNTFGIVIYCVGR